MATIAYDPLQLFEGFFKQSCDDPPLEKSIDSDHFVVVDVLEVTESFVLEVDSVPTVSERNPDLKLNILLWMGAGLFALVISGFAYVLNSMDSHRQELQGVLNGKASEALLIETQNEIREARKDFSEQVKMINSDMRADRAEAINRHLEIIKRLPPPKPE